jgi:hypothetical protein
VFTTYGSERAVVQAIGHRLLTVDASWINPSAVRVGFVVYKVSLAVDVTMFWKVAHLPSSHGWLSVY